MFKIKLDDGEFYKNTSLRVQHFKSEEQAKNKIEKLGNIGTGAIVVESKARTTIAKTEKETASDAKAVKVSKTKKASTKPDKSASVKGKQKK